MCIGNSMAAKSRILAAIEEVGFGYRCDSGQSDDRFAMTATAE
jgi:hypothetical protein